MLTLVSVHKWKNEHRTANNSLVFSFFVGGLCFRLENASAAQLDGSVAELLFLVPYLLHIPLCCIKLSSLCFGEEMILTDTAGHIAKPCGKAVYLSQ